MPPEVVEVVDPAKVLSLEEAARTTTIDVGLGGKEILAQFQRLWRLLYEEGIWFTNVSTLVNTHLEVIEVADLGAHHTLPAAGSHVASLLKRAYLTSITTFVAF